MPQYQAMIYSKTDNGLYNFIETSRAALGIVYIPQGTGKF